MPAKQRVWITGGGSGIGAALADLYVKAGADVVISGRDAGRLQQVAARYANESAAGHSAAGSIRPLVFDASDESSVDKVALQLAELLGGLDLAIFSAGVCEYVDGPEQDVALYRRVYAANLFGAVNSVNVALQLMLDTSDARAVHAGNRPQIVALSSLSTVTGLPRAEAYGSSKAAVDYLFDTLTIDLASSGIDVATIQPGFVTTPMTSQNDFPMPFEVDAATAAKRIYGAIHKRKRLYRFPRRLFYLLRIASAWPWLWYRFIAPKLAR